MRVRDATIFLISAAIVACAAGSHPRGIENTPGGGSQSPAGPIVDGMYQCSFTDGDYEYPPFPCQVTTSGGATTLTKLAGSQRIQGAVTPTTGGFHFAGTFFCPYGDCTTDVTADFTGASGTFEGRLSNKVLVRITPAPAGYGGGAYGYGGGGYGYGAAPPAQTWDPGY